MELNKIYQGDTLEVLKTFPDESVDMVITSPPYYCLRDYGIAGQIGLEKTYQEYLGKLIAIFDEAKRILKPMGSCWVNIGDTYSGNKNGNTNGKVSDYLKEESIGIHKRAELTEKCLLQIPNRFAIMMTDHGWILRNEIIWHKPNAMPDGVLDRFTVDFEKLFFFTKNKNYCFEQQKVPMKTMDVNPPRGSTAVLGQKNSGRRNAVTDENKTSDFMKNMRCVWTIPTKPFKGSHFAVFPEALVEMPIKACCPENGIVLDVFMGSGTTGVVAKKLGRNFVGIDLNEKYVLMAEQRTRKTFEQKSLF